MIQQINTIKIIAAVIFSFGLVICTGCSGNNKNTDQLSKEIMSIHDSTMAKMSYMLKLRHNISNLLAESSSITLTDSLNGISYQLTKADKDMMAWMHQYNEPGMESDTAAEYLKSQHAKMISIANETNAAIKNAENILNQPR